MHVIIAKLQTLYDNTHKNGSSCPDVAEALKDTSEFLQKDLGRIIDILHDEKQHIQDLEKENAMLRRLLTTYMPIEDVKVVVVSA